jgi:hypothetical protein
MSNSLLSLLPAGLAVEQVVVHPDRVVVAVRARAATASCPLCRRRSRRVHSRYVRHLGDLPWQGRIGHLDLQVRRFRCSAPRCPRRIFAEHLPEVALPRVRRTVRLAEAQRDLPPLWRTPQQARYDPSGGDGWRVFDGHSRMSSRPRPGHPRVTAAALAA